MKKIQFLALLPVVLLAAGCSFVKDDKTKPITNSPIVNTQGSVCAIAAATSSSDAVAKTILPPVSQEEKKKTFTYEDEDMGVKLRYPGSCFFNKGVFQCSDFTLSIWVLDDGTKASATPEKTLTDTQTQIRYTYNHNGKVYALMAWYDGTEKSDLNAVIDKIAKSLSFTR